MAPGIVSFSFYFSITGVPPWWQYNTMWLQEHYHYNHNLHKASSRQCDLQESPVGAVDDENAAMVGNFAGAGVGTGGETYKILDKILDKFAILGKDSKTLPEAQRTQGIDSFNLSYLSS